MIVLSDSCGVANGAIHPKSKATKFASFRCNLRLLVQQLGAFSRHAFLGSTMKLSRRHFLQLVGPAAIHPAASGLAWAQTYPVRPVRMIIPAAAGGPSDLIGRLIAQKLSEVWRQQFIVENIPTGAGNVAAAMVAKALPDGYTVLLPTSGVVTNPSLYSKLGYDTIHDFAAVTLAAAAPHVLAINPMLPAKDVQGFISIVKANPGKYSYASPGTGTTGQLAGELFRISLGLDLTHVPFNGAAPAITSTIAGHTPVMFGALPGAASSIKEGQLRALAVTGAKRDPGFPDLPTMLEAGVPDQESEFIQGVFVPTGTPKEIIDKLYAEIARIVRTAAVKERLAKIGFTPVGNTPEEFSAQIKRDIARWAMVIRGAGIKLMQ
jgi:tripartite-type tricarboxylate transporter receptor subunit TctC